MTNRLSSESSPYLLQHAENPVDWYPWSAEALNRSKTEDKPIFLSIGYSACHWCHVMEHESFEDQEIAEVLNEHFICIKVDREERPDLDQIYMNAVMAIRGGGGGWPLSVFLTPSQEVFFGGTYWPPRSRMNMPGFDHVLNSVLDAFRNRREQVESQSRQVSEWLNEVDLVDDKTQISSDLFLTAVDTLHSNFDFENGGFGGAPKFPHPMDLELLMRLSRRWPTGCRPGRNSIMEMVEVNLKKMAKGGIFDHLAGGFARYSVDEYWLVPHFEKMLYDNALLASIYVEMYQETDDAFYGNVATQTLGYLLREMTDVQGGFYSTVDADSEGVEGKFYVWDRQEVLDILGPETGELFCQVYHVSEAGNFEGRNILNLTKTVDEFAEGLGLEQDAFEKQMRLACRKLREVRSHRVPPGLDDKVLVSWNALAISAMARGAVGLKDGRNEEYLTAAEKAAAFILQELTDEQGRLLHTWRKGEAKLAAYLDDYAYLIVALLDLYRASFDETWIDHASDLAEVMICHFQGEYGFFFTADDHESLIARSQSFQDSSVPSGNAMAALALERLARLLGKPEWNEMAVSILRGAIPLMKRSPLASGQMLVALQWVLEPSVELIFFAENQSEFKRLEEHLQARKLDSLSVICRQAGCHTSSLVDHVLQGKEMLKGEPTLFVCQNHTCQAPSIGWNAIERVLVDLGNQELNFERAP
ncbi:MAG: thioredoxin domain-containing protein [Mariniblastus sp.]|nr:thioredoxin domain-containing protein [Mariniblastus sp.]